MNSQFKNSSLGFYLYATIIVFIAVASVVVFWYMISGYKLGTYPEDTILGSVYIGGLKEEDVKLKVENRIGRWLNDDTVVFELTYQDYSYQFDREIFFFDIDLSQNNLEEGETNILFANYQGTDRDTVKYQISTLPFLEGIKDNIDINQIITDILADAGLMKSYSSKKVEDYIIDKEAAITIVESNSMRIFDGVYIDDFLDKINIVYPDGKIVATHKELFEVIDVFGSEMTDSEMSVLSTGMMDLLLATNFNINEVHYNPNFDHSLYTVDNYPYLGHNAKVSRVINQDFSFYNPNDSDYYFTVEKKDETNIIFKLHGLAFVDDISVLVSTIPVEYVTQSTNDSSILQSGYNGSIVEVTREIVNVDGNVSYNNKIVFEFYPPVKEIVLQIQLP